MYVVNPRRHTSTSILEFVLEREPGTSIYIFPPWRLAPGPHRIHVLIYTKYSDRSRKFTLGYCKRHSSALSSSSSYSSSDFAHSLQNAGSPSRGLKVTRLRMPSASQMGHMACTTSTSSSVRCTSQCNGTPPTGPKQALRMIPASLHVPHLEATKFTPPFSRCFLQ